VFLRECRFKCRNRASPNSELRSKLMSISYMDNSFPYRRHDLDHNEEAIEKLRWSFYLILERSERGREGERGRVAA
jgi:hypothetical protein